MTFTEFYDSHTWPPDDSSAMAYHAYIITKINYLRLNYNLMRIINHK